MTDITFIDALKDANLTYDVAVERNLNIPAMRRQLENVLWTYRRELVDLGKSLQEAHNEIAELNEMLDALGKLNTGKPDEERPETEDPPKKKAR